ncbi:MAG: ABC transporter permease [Bifidobacteriaceae bacterium]|nr:ABC transporter permease [Bifidobacteriaceae bacterium]
MFFLRVITQSIRRQLARRMLIMLTVALSACISIAMLGIVFDVGDKLNAELSTYGSNIIVQPKSDAVVSDLYNAQDNTARVSEHDPTSFLKESDAVKIKTIFWAYNITNFAPELTLHMNATHNGAVVKNVATVGTWFNKTLELNSGETTVVGVRGLRSWWSVQGKWAADDSEQVMVGITLAKQLGVSVGDTITLQKASEQKAAVVGIFDSGDEDNNTIYMPSILAQEVANKPNSINKIEVKALTTPENDLARKAARNPAALTQDEWEIWYCTAYPSSITYQIEEVLPDAVAKQVRQVAALQGSVLNKTSAVMIVMTALSLIAAAVAVANLMAASIGERSSELALLKAMGANNASVCRLIMAETALVSLVGAVVGAICGVGVAQIVGYTVFNAGITMRPMVFILVFVLLAVTVCVAALSVMRLILRVQPAEVLHGR